MRLSTLLYSLLISCLSSVLFPSTLKAQALYPLSEGDRVELMSSIDMGKGYISGVCMLLKNGQTIKGGVFNEFGVSAINFTYNEDKDKVKIISVIKMLNKWYIRKLLKKDLRHVMHELKKGHSTYKNEKYHITYVFSPIERNENDD